MQIFIISSATEVKLKFRQTYEHNITRRMAVIDICKFIRISVCGSWFRQKCICYTLSDAVQHVCMSLPVDEVAMYFVSAIFISVNGCALVQFAAHDD